MQIAEDFDIFVAIVDAGSISEASRVLGVPRATLSRKLARLEERLGVRLLHRTTRRLIPTPAGEALYPRARSLVEAARASVEAVQRLDDVPRGLLRVSAAPLHTPVLGLLIGEFLQQYPQVQIELYTSARYVDLMGEQVDIALRGGVVQNPSLMVKPLLRTELFAFATPSYLARCGTPASPADLAGHNCLRGFVEGTRRATTWPLRDGTKVAVRGSLVTNDMMALQGATLAGTGIALLLEDFVRDEMARGELVTVLPETIGMEAALALVWAERAYLEPKVRAFIDTAVRWVANGLLQGRYNKGDF